MINERFIPSTCPGDKLKFVRIAEQKAQTKIKICSEVVEVVEK